MNDEWMETAPHQPVGHEGGIPEHQVDSVYFRVPASLEQAGLMTPAERTRINRYIAAELHAWVEVFHRRSADYSAEKDATAVTIRAVYERAAAQLRARAAALFPPIPDDPAEIRARLTDLRKQYPPGTARDPRTRPDTITDQHGDTWRWTDADKQGTPGYQYAGGVTMELSSRGVGPAYTREYVEKGGNR